MVSAIDSSVILDVLLGDPTFGRISLTALRRAHLEGSLIVCDAVLAEVHPVPPPNSLAQFIREFRLCFVPSSLASATLAGQMYTNYLTRGGKRGRIVADFLIGAHAQTHAARLLARDFGYFRDYFKHLNVYYPT